MLVSYMFTVNFGAVFIVCNMGPILNKTDMSRDSVFCHCDIGRGGCHCGIGGGGEVLNGKCLTADKKVHVS